MNRTELIERVASTASLDKKQAEAAVSAFVDTVIAATKDGDKVSIFGFGSFVPKDRAAREGRNPQTGAKVKIAASKAVGFTPSAAYKATLNTKKSASRKAAPAKATKAPATKASATKASATKASASKAPAAKAPASKAPASKASASKVSAAKAPAKKTTTVKAAAPAKKATKATRATKK